MELTISVLDFSSDVQPEQHAQMQQMSKTFRDVFSTKISSFRFNEEALMALETEDAALNYSSFSSCIGWWSKLMKEYLDNIPKRRIIRLNMSFHSSTAMLVRKTGTDERRFVIEYQRLNKISHYLGSSFWIEEVSGALNGAQWFSYKDHVWILAATDICIYCSFHCGKLWEFMIMLSGWGNAPQHFNPLWPSNFRDSLVLMSGLRKWRFSTVTLFLSFEHSKQAMTEW